MFSGETGQSAFVFPLLEPDAVAGAFTEALYSGYGRVIYLPGIMRYITMLVSLFPPFFYPFATLFSKKRISQFANVWVGMFAK